MAPRSPLSPSHTTGAVLVICGCCLCTPAQGTCRVLPCPCWHWCQLQKGHLYFSGWPLNLNLARQSLRGQLVIWHWQCCPCWTSSSCCDQESAHSPSPWWEWAAALTFALGTLAQFPGTSCFFVVYHRNVTFQRAAGDMQVRADFAVA